VGCWASGRGRTVIRLADERLGEQTPADLDTLDAVADPDDG
jgi:hypothetical protein